MCDWVKLTKSRCSDDDEVVCLSQFDSDEFEVKELLDESVWVVYRKDPEFPGTKNFAFLRYSYSDDNIYCDVMMHGYGFSESLRECRHTYWGEDGYIFYPDSRHIRAILDELEIHFDMD
jgi:hypothetical protein